MANATKVTEVEVEECLAAIEFARGSIAHLAQGRNLADELIAERRAEGLGSRIAEGRSFACNND